MEIPPAAVPQLAFNDLNTALKQVVSQPVVAFGRIKDPVAAERILRDGQADLIGMARQLITDPETPNKVRDGRLDDIRHCIACNDACVYQVMQENPIRCVHNPAAGRELELGPLLRPRRHAGRRCWRWPGGTHRCRDPRLARACRNAPRAAGRTRWAHPARRSAALHGEIADATELPDHAGSANSGDDPPRHRGRSP